MTDRNDDDMMALDALLGAARGQNVVPSDDLMARVLADAALISAPEGVKSRVKQGRFAALLEMIGGWPAVSGLAAAGVAGLWIGVAPPAGLEALAAEVLGSTVSVDLLGDSFGFDAEVMFDG